MISSNEKLAVFQRGPVVLFQWHNAEGWPVHWCSPNVKDICGYNAEDFMSGTVAYAGLIHPDDIDQVTQEVTDALAKNLDSFEHEPYRIIHRDKSVRWLHDVTHLLRKGDEVTHFVGYVVDITSRMNVMQRSIDLEKQLLHAQKLESLGVLAGGVAHDFNNLLTGILGEATLARLEYGTPNGETLRNIDQIELLAMRAAELTRQLLAYSGKGRFVVQPLDLSELMREITSMLNVAISKKAALELHLSDDLPAIAADQAQIQQIAMNLLTNASDALGEEQGVIRIKTGRETVSADTLREVYGAKDLPSGVYVTLEVSDNGCGISAETRKRLFDPFFTTKATGRGLGMSAVLGIVLGHQGAIRVYSEPGQGTAFKLLFPAIEDTAIALRSSETKKQWKGTGTVLVVDDEPSVLSVATRMLTHLGFEAIVASNGQEALAMYQQHSDDIVLVLLDMMMPVMNGRETLAALRRITPDLPIVMSSGFNEQEAISRIAARGMTSFLQKPYELEDLEAAVRAVIH